jgi:hypothetical protein
VIHDKCCDVNNELQLPMSWLFLSKVVLLNFGVTFTCIRQQLGEVHAPVSGHGFVWGFYDVTLITIILWFNSTTYWSQMKFYIPETYMVPGQLMIFCQNQLFFLFCEENEFGWL